jgi:hypothetical protein
MLEVTKKKIANTLRGKKHSVDRIANIKKSLEGKSTRERKIKASLSRGMNEFYAIRIADQQMVWSGLLKSECADFLQINRYKIRDILYGIRKSHKGYTFRYVSRENNQVLKPEDRELKYITRVNKGGYSITIKKKYSMNFPIANLDYNLLEKQDAIVLNELKDIPQALQTTLKSFVNKGGNVVIIPAQESNVNAMNSFLSNFGAIQLKAIASSDKKVTKINFNHPLFSNVFEKKIDNFQYPSTKTAFGINSTTPSILSYEDQSAFLTSISNPLSSVYVFAAPINKTNSNFQNSPLIVPTFYNMAQSSRKDRKSVV